MGSREKILENIRRASVNEKPLPQVKNSTELTVDPATSFAGVLGKIGGTVVEVNGWEGVERYVRNQYQGLSRIISTIPELPWFIPALSDDPHTFESVDLSVLRGHFGVAENGAVWITDKLMGDRSIPFISQHLALVIDRKDIVHSLVEAYERMSSHPYDYGTFIAGPSKTADIEQSLVLGAHGPKSMVVFLMT